MNPEIQEKLIAETFLSSAFVVSAGNLTDAMCERIGAELERMAKDAKGQVPKGVTLSWAAYIVQLKQQLTAAAKPAVAPVAVLEKLASVLKVFVNGDSVVDASTQIALKRHFATTPLEPHCDAVWLAALPSDVVLSELVQLGMDKNGAPRGTEKVGLGRCVKTKVFSGLMPNGELADDYVCLLELLQIDADLTRGKIEWNEMDGGMEIGRRPAEEDLTTGDIRAKIGTLYSVKAHRGTSRFVPSDTSTRQALQHLARLNKYNPAAEYFSSLRGTWDGVDHASQLPTLMGVVLEKEEPPLDLTGRHLKLAELPEIETAREKKARAEYTERNEKRRAKNRLVLSQLVKTLLGLVARTFVPGAKMDTMLTLKGSQGVRKSTLFKALAPAGRFTSKHIDPSDKDTFMLLGQNSICEVAELSGLSKADQELMKSFMSNDSDDYRRPYERTPTRHPRWCILVGTTNEEVFLKDPTGSRRFWVIKIDDKLIDINGIRAILPQLWAQIVALYDASASCADCSAAVDGQDRCQTHRWWLSPEEEKLRAEVNEEFTEEDMYFTQVQEWAHAERFKDQAWGKDGIKMSQVLNGIGVPPEKQLEARHAQKAGAALRKLGYEKDKTGKKGVGSIWKEAVEPPKTQRTALEVEAALATDGAAMAVRLADAMERAKKARKAVAVTQEQASKFPDWEEAAAAADAAALELIAVEQEIKVRLAATTLEDWQKSKLREVTRKPKGAPTKSETKQAVAGDEASETAAATPHQNGK